MVERAQKRIFWIECYVHALNNTLKEIGKIDQVEVVVVEARDIPMFICNHHTYNFSVLSKEMVPQTSGEQICQQFYIAGEDVRGARCRGEWKKQAQSKSEGGKLMRVRLLNDTWWSNIR